MALVGSLSGTLETGIVAITGSLIPSSTAHDLGSNSFKWGSVYANNITGSIRSTAAGSDFIIAGPNATVNYNSSGQWEVTGASSAASIFTAATADAAYTTSSIAIGFSAAASSKGSNVFFAVSGSDPTSNTALFSGEVVTSGSIIVKNASAAVTAQITNAGVISGSALQSLGNLDVQGSSNLIGNVTVTGDVAVNGGDLTSTATSFNLLNTGVTSNLNIGGAAATTSIGSATGKVVVPGDFEVQGTTVTVDVTNITIEDPLIGLGFTTSSAAATAGDRGFIGGRNGTSNVAFAWAQTSDAFVATTTTSVPGDASVVFTPAELKPIRASRFQVSGTNALIYSPDGTNLVAGSTVTTEVSGNIVQLNASTNGVAFLRETAGFLAISSGTSTLSTNLSRVIATGNTNKSIVLGAPQLAVVSGTQVYALGGNNGFMVQRFGTDMFQINSTDGSTLNLAAQSGFGTVNLVNAVATTVNFAGGATRVNIGSSIGTGSFAGNLEVTGSTVLGNASSDDIVFSGSVASNILPKADVLYNLGSATFRWANIYTGDLHLRNERGDYTLIEEADFLSIRFNKTGKRYKFVLEAVPELDEK